MNRLKVGVRFFESFYGGSAAMRRAIIHDPEDPVSPSIGLLLHDLLDQPAKGFNAGGALTTTKHFGATDISECGPRVELCDFTAGFKEELFPRLRSTMERGLVFIPSSTSIREDLHRVQRHPTSTGQRLYRARQTPDGHSDRTVALALSVRAAEYGPTSQPATVVGQPHLRGI